MKRLVTTKLENWKHSAKRKPLIIKGARQIGKTYILQEFGQKSFKNFHYLNFEEKTELKKYFERQFWYIPNPSYQADVNRLTMEEQEWLKSLEK